jgi:hypothetical protein
MYGTGGAERIGRSAAEAAETAAVAMAVAARRRRARAFMGTNPLGEEILKQFMEERERLAMTKIQHRSGLGPAC